MDTVSNQLNIQDFIDVEYIMSDYSDANNKAATRRGLWSDLAEIVSPGTVGYKSPYGGAVRSSADWRTFSNLSRKAGVTTSVPAMYVDNLCATLYYLLIDPKSEYIDLGFQENVVLTIGDKENKQAIHLTIPKFEALQNWLMNCKKILLELLGDPTSNFHSSGQEVIRNLVICGCACHESMLTLDGDIKCNSISMSDICFGVSGYGEINRVFRLLHKTKREAIDLWGQAVFTDNFDLQNMESFQKTNTKEDYLEYTAGTPAELRQQGFAPYMSIVIRVGDKRIISYSLHNSFPYVTPRYQVEDGDIYGSSPVQRASSDIYLMNDLAKMIVKNGRWVNEPPILYQNNSSLAFKTLAPGAFVQGLDANLRPQYTVMQGMGGNITVQFQYYQLVEQSLARQLAIGQPLTVTKDRMTDDEVNARIQQSNIQSYPVISRLESEWLNPLTKRLFRLYSDQGRFPPFPYQQLSDIMNQMYGDSIIPAVGLKEVNAQIMQMIIPDPISLFRIHFSGNAARMQKMNEIQIKLQIFQLAMQAAQIDQSVLYRLDPVGLLKGIWEAYGTDIVGFRSEEDAQQMQQQAQQTAANQNESARAQTDYQKAQTQKVEAETAKLRGML